VCSYVFLCFHVLFSLVCIRFRLLLRVIYFLLVWFTYSLLVFVGQKVVQRLQQFIAEYEDLMWKRNLVPMFSYDRGLIRTRYDVDCRPRSY